jgi:hypothetical protein
VRIILDTAILVRGHGESDRILLLSNEMLRELARVLRYPRMLALHGLSEKRICDYVGFLREAGEIVVPNPLLVTPIRDVNDTVVMQTAVIGVIKPVTMPCRAGKTPAGPIQPAAQS